jgi:HPt (histidine-containing phosphotransfer) domain-containing protein
MKAERICGPEMGVSYMRSDIKLPAEQAVPTVFADTVLDLAHLSRQTMGDSGLRREILVMFLDESVVHLDRLQAAGDTRAWRMAAHTLKGVALNVGAFSLARVCGEVEHLDLVGGAANQREALNRVIDMMASTCDVVLEVLGNP